MWRLLCIYILFKHLISGQSSEIFLSPIQTRPKQGCALLDLKCPSAPAGQLWVACSWVACSWIFRSTVGGQKSSWIRALNQRAHRSAPSICVGGGSTFSFLHPQIGLGENGRQQRDHRRSMGVEFEPGDSRSAWIVAAHKQGEILIIIFLIDLVYDFDIIC